MTDTMTSKHLVRLTWGYQVGTLLLCVLATFVGLRIAPLEYVFGGAIAVATAMCMKRNPSILLFAFILLVILSKLQDREDGAPGLSIIDILAGIVVITVLLYTIYDSLFTRKLTFYHPALWPLLLASFWGIIIGLLYTIIGDTTLNFLFREYSIFWSIVAVPLLYREASHKDPTFEKKLLRVLVVAWLLVQVVAILRVRSSMVAAFYLYQSGVSRIAVVNTVLMLFMLFTFYATSIKRKSLKWYIAAIMLTIIGIICTFERTVWVMLVVLIPAIIIWSPKQERVKAAKALFYVVSLFIIAGIIGYFLFPIVGVVLRYWLDKFLSSSHLKTDLSIVNRYIEWRGAIKQIVQTPVLGLGFGGRYMSYTWFVGRTYLGGYIHNSYLGLILKLGIPGFIAVMLSYCWFLLLGIKLSYVRFLSTQERLLLRAGVMVLVLCLVRFMIANTFNERADLAYIGLIWGYFIVKYENVRNVRRQIKAGIVSQTSLP
jgi:O-antigen ligase